jgi:hypothetical protein
MKYTANFVLLIGESIENHSHESITTVIEADDINQALEKAKNMLSIEVQSYEKFVLGKDCEYKSYTIGNNTIEKNHTEDLPKEDYSSLTVTEAIRNISYKSLTYAFMSLPYVKRERIIQDLALGREEDEGLKHVQILVKIIQRAEEQECIEKFWEEIQLG